MRCLIAIALFVLVASGRAATRPGVSFAQPGATAIVRLELKPDRDVLFNRNGPSAIRVLNPFGQSFEQKLPRGTPWLPDAQHYDQRVPTLEFRIPVPKGTKPGTYSLTLATELFLCDAVQHICYRAAPKLETTIEVGQAGRDQKAVLELGRPTKPGF